MSSKPFCQFVRASQLKALELVAKLDQCDQQTKEAKEIERNARERLHTCSFFPAEVLACSEVAEEDRPKLEALFEAYRQTQTRRLEQAGEQLTSADKTLDALAHELQEHDAVLTAAQVFFGQNNFYPEVDADLPEPGQLESGFQAYLALVTRELVETTRLIKRHKARPFDTHAYNWARTTINFEGGDPDVAKSLDELLACRMMLRGLRQSQTDVA